MLWSSSTQREAGKGLKRDWVQTQHLMYCIASTHTLSHTADRLLGTGRLGIPNEITKNDKEGDRSR